MKPIVLNTRMHPEACIGTVRLTPEAERVIRRLGAKTGLPIQQIVSEIIIQAENLIEIYDPNARGPRPAFLAPLPVEDEDEESAISLEAYSAKDLLQELARRVDE